jgi:hypothetical protein
MFLLELPLCFGFRLGGLLEELLEGITLSLYDFKVGGDFFDGGEAGNFFCKAENTNTNSVIRYTRPQSVMRREAWGQSGIHTFMFFDASLQDCDSLLALRIALVQPLNLCLLLQHKDAQIFV